MKFPFYILCFCFLGISTNLLSQNNISLDLKNVTLHQIIWELEKQTKIDFIYSTAETEKVVIKHLSVTNSPLSAVLDKVLENSGLTYEPYEGVIIIKPDNLKTIGDSPQQKQKISVNGIVMDDSGGLLPGVSILLKGSASIGTITNSFGEYELDFFPVSNKSTLIFSCVGMETQEIRIPESGGVLNVMMVTEEPELDEVVVTGYGNLKKNIYAGSASIIDARKLADIPATSINQLLEGNSTGVQVTSSTNQPGSPSNVRIRGIGSYSTSSAPLYVIDGVPVISGDISAIPYISSNAPGTDALATLSTSDIDNVAIIKDAAAASLYGSRAANGVIMITTKSGKKGKTRFNVKANMGFSEFAMPYREIMNGEDRRNIMYEGFYNEAIYRKNQSSEEAGKYADGKINTSAPIPWNGFVNWDDYLFRKGSYRNYEASANGGNEFFGVYGSIIHNNLEGATYNSGLKRTSGRMNLDWKATNKISIGLKTLFSYLNQDVFSEGMTYTSPFYSSRNAVTPSDPVYLEDGSYNRNFIRNSDRNPKLSMDYNFKEERIIRTFNTAYIQYLILEGLSLKTTYSYDFTMSEGDSWDDPRTSDGRSSNGSRSKRIYQYKKWLWSNYLNYSRNLNEAHFLDAIFAYDMEGYERDYLAANTKNFLDPNLPSITNGADLTSISGHPSEWRMVSLISRLNYNYLSKYYGGVSFRYDGSSRLPRKSRWGSFWSLSGAWRISEEKYMEDYKNTLSDLRLRFSYGTNATLPTSSTMENNSNYYRYYSLSSLSGVYMGNPAITPSQLENSNLKWEKNYNMNMGLDIGLFSRINVSLELYKRTTRNLLMNFPISRTTGFSYYLKNIGKMQNKGIDIEISSLNLLTKDFRWTSNLNLGKNKNKILVLDGLVTEQINGYHIHREGLPYYTYYLVEFAGIDPDDGEPMFVLNTKNEDGTINQETTKDHSKAERIPFKGVEPDLSGGFSNSFMYKYFDLSFMFNFSYGGWSYDSGAEKSEHGGSDMKANVPIYYKDRWQKPGDVTTIEKYQSGRTILPASSRRLHPLDYVRLKSLTFGIKLPNDWTKTVGTDQIRVYASGTNLWTWAKWNFYDPESSDADGYVYWEQPPLRTWTFGIDIRF